MVQRYLCFYKTNNGGRFGSEVWAKPETLAATLEARNIGETVGSAPSSTRSAYGPLHQCLRVHGATPETLHYAVLLVGWPSSQASLRSMKPWEITVLCMKLRIFCISVVVIPACH